MQEPPKHQVCHPISRVSMLNFSSWMASSKLPGPVADTISCLIAAKSPEIDLYISGKHWRPGTDSSSSSMLIESLKSLACLSPHRRDISFIWNFFHLQSLELQNFSLHELVSSLPSNPLPALRRLKLVFWTSRGNAVADSQLSYLLLSLRPLEHLDVTCSDEHLDASVIARHTPLRVLKLQNQGVVSGAGRSCRSFNQSSFK